MQTRRRDDRLATILFFFFFLSFSCPNSSSRRRIIYVRDHRYATLSRSYLSLFFYFNLNSNTKYMALQDDRYSDSVSLFS